MSVQQRSRSECEPGLPKVAPRAFPVVVLWGVAGLMLAGCGISVTSSEADSPTPLPTQTPEASPTERPATPTPTPEVTGTPTPEPPPPTTPCPSSAENCIEGTSAGYTFGPIGSAVFSYPSEADPDTSPLSFMADYAWECAQLQARPPIVPHMPATQNASEVVSSMSFTLGRYDTTVGGILGMAATGSYRIVNSQRGLEENERVAFVTIAFTDSLGTVEILENAADGTLEVESLNLSEEMTGHFSLVLSSGDDFSGVFALEPCEFPPFG